MYRVLKPGGRLVCLEFSKPTAPLIGWLYDAYSFHVMPTLGWIIVGSQQAYRYLSESIRAFPMPDELSSLLTDIGFARVTHWKLTNGIAVIHGAQKP
jgi:demethylmenaquinone methyltransferase/2-methoxy-6-polyprenyl-1,4-benzoquinol methylase